MVTLMDSLMAYPMARSRVLLQVQNPEMVIKLPLVSKVHQGKATKQMEVKIKVIPMPMNKSNKENEDNNPVLKLIGWILLRGGPGI